LSTESYLIQVKIFQKPIDIALNRVYYENAVDLKQVNLNGGELMYPNIEAERARHGWSRMQLAEQLDVSYSTMKNWMRGVTEIPASKIMAMAKMFNCSTDYLLGLDTGRHSA